MEKLSCEQYIEKYYEPVSQDSWVSIQELQQGLKDEDLTKFYTYDLERMYEKLIYDLNNFDK